ncbi:transporter [Clostridia bacterium]|nr:transporter [Clostridia bacterium]
MQVVLQVTIMAVLMAVGFLLTRLKVLKNADAKPLTAVVINLANPATLIVAFEVKYTPERLTELLASTALAVIAHLAGMLIARLLIRGKDKGRVSVERLSVIYTNCGFMGIPLVYGVFGSEGVFCLSAFYVVMSLLVFTHGAMTLQGSANKEAFKKVLKNPAIAAIVVGVVIFLTGFQLPEIIGKPIEYFAGVTTPLAMVVAGITIAGAKLKELFTSPRLYYISAVRLFVVPLAALGVSALMALPFGISELVIKVNFLAAACPTATMCVMLALEHGRDSALAARIFALTTILSLVSIPLLMWLI